MSEMNIGLVEGVLLVLLGGIFGWLLGKMPLQWVYVVMAIAVILAVVVLSGATA